MIKFTMLFTLIIFFVLLFLCFKNSYNKNNKYDINYVNEYDVLLHDERWYDKRRIILERDNHTCQWCGKTTNLQVHHKYYNKYPNDIKVEPWNYPDDALITLCNDCHKKCHDKYVIKTYYRKYFNNF